MRLLLDTHALIWWVASSYRLSETGYRAISDDTNDKLISAASVWEIAIKHRSGRLDEADALVLDMPGIIAAQGFQELPITVDDALKAGGLPGHHGDPFDRMLIAQSMVHDLVLVSREALFDRYGVRRLW